MKMSYLVSVASEVPPGGSEEEAKEAVKQLFRPANTRNYKQLSKADIEELARMEREEEDYQESLVVFG